MAIKFSEHVEQAKAKIPIPVSVITGFLGSGKTTLLNHILNGDHGLHIAVVVNDFGNINIDSQLITDVQGDVISLANGCVCCTVQGSMVDAIENLLDQFIHTPDYILIEASGVAETGGIVRGLNYPQLRDRIRVESVIGLMDAAEIDGLNDKMAQVARSQLASAHIVVINKTDLISPKQLEAIRKKWLFPNTRVFETTYADVPLELVVGVGKYDPARHLECTASCEQNHDEYQDHDQIFETWCWAHEGLLDTERFQQFVKGLPKSVYRSKGFVHLSTTPEQKVVLHVVGNRKELNMGTSWEGMEPVTQLVFIGEQGSFDASDIQQQLEACCF